MTSKQHRGFTLIELMVALVLGLIMTGALLSAFIANRNVYAATESLGRVQENARAAFELMARDIREAGGTPCNSQVEPVNVVRNHGSLTYADFAGGLVGYDGDQGGIPFGTAARERTAGTDAVVLKSAGDDVYRVTEHEPNSVNIKTAQIVPTDWDNQIVLVCDPEHAAIFQVTDVSSGSVKHQSKSENNQNAPSWPGNATKCLGPADVGCLNGSTQTYGFGCAQGEMSGTACKLESAPAVIARLRSVSWFVGRGTKSGSSLYRHVGGKGSVADEIAEHVRSLEMQYLLDGTYQDASAVTTADGWARVSAMRLSLEFEGEDRSGSTGGEGLTRRVATTVALRNRLQ